MDEFAGIFLPFSVKAMETAQKHIDACLGQLTEAQIWHRGGDHENSVANLLLHLEGNLRQWFLHGMDGQPNVRTRDQEFAAGPASDVSSRDLRDRLADTNSECRRLLAALPPARLLEHINPQPGGGWGEPTILEAICHVVGHLQLHTGQIILLTKQLTGRDLDLTLPRKR